MQFTLSINQPKAKEWGLNAQQALLFSFVYSVPSWANSVVKDDGSVFYALAKQKIIEELPLLTDKIDTAYRMLRQLSEKGIIELSSTGSITLIRITEIGKQWNKKIDGSEKYPNTNKGRKNIRSGSEKNPSEVGKISEEGSEKNPTNHDTSNHVTNHDTSNQNKPSGKREKKSTQLPEDFQPNDTAKRKAESSGLNIQEQLEYFKDYHAARGSTFKDWQAAFRTWLNNANRFATPINRYKSKPRSTPGMHTNLPDFSNVKTREDGTVDF
ncbi:hypothetical protein LMG33818_000017 [Halomonadaceae bacterium LMG 33818]|uniref:hypothetical protein n=1 Tax=Cernens ardua TaxID=3402176 RepID=UPI003EDB83A8